MVYFKYVSASIMLVKWMAEGFCFKCRTKRTISGAKEQVLKNKRKALVGKCAVCGTKIVRFVS